MALITVEMHLMKDIGMHDALVCYCKEQLFAITSDKELCLTTVFFSRKLRMNFKKKILGQNKPLYQFVRF